MFNRQTMLKYSKAFYKRIQGSKTLKRRTKYVCKLFTCAKKIVNIIQIVENMFKKCIKLPK